MAIGVMMMPVLMKWRRTVIAKDAQLRQVNSLIRQHGRWHDHAAKRQPQKQGKQNQRPEDHQLCRTVHARVHKRGILHQPVFGQTDFNHGYPTLM